MQRVESGTPVNISAGGIISKAAGNLLGFYVNSTSLGTMIVYNGTTATSPSVAISGTITPAIGWRDFPSYCPNGCYIDITSGSLNITAFFAAG